MTTNQRTKSRTNGSGSLFKRGGRGPWIAKYYDHLGRRRQHSTKTTDRKAAERILAKLVSDAALRRDGVVDARTAAVADHGRTPLAEHIAAYVEHCRRTGQSETNTKQKADYLGRLAEHGRMARLTDLTAEAVERFMASLKAEGRSARTSNYARQTALAFCSWCADTNRLAANPVAKVKPYDESRDRRRVRRALTDDELARLLDVAGDRGRRAWYLAAALAGLRKGDLKRLRWCDIDFTEDTITVADGKAKRTDVVPLHPQLAEELQHRHTEAMATPKAKVFPTTVTDRTRRLDFLRAGLAREEIVRDEHGNPVMTGKRKPRPQTRILCEDEEGRVIDLHAMRTTLGTNLARAGVAPQLAQRIMRHSDYRTTLKHYTVLGLTDTSRAMADVPAVGSTNHAAEATGTHDATPGGGATILRPMAAPTDANGCETVRQDDQRGQSEAVTKTPIKQSENATMRDDARLCDDPRGVAQLGRAPALGAGGRRFKSGHPEST